MFGGMPQAAALSNGGAHDLVKSFRGKYSFADFSA